MRVQVVQCECHNPKPHRKLQGDEMISQGFFSVEQGKRFLDVGAATGAITQTHDEKAATIREIEACGLPAKSRVPTDDEIIGALLSAMLR